MGYDFVLSVVQDFPVPPYVDAFPVRLGGWIHDIDHPVGNQLVTSFCEAYRQVGLSRRVNSPKQDGTVGELLAQRGRDQPERWRIQFNGWVGGNQPIIDGNHVVNARDVKNGHGACYQDFSERCLDALSVAADFADRILDVVAPGRANVAGRLLPPCCLLVDDGQDVIAKAQRPDLDVGVGDEPGRSQAQIVRYDSASQVRLEGVGPSFGARVD